MTNLLDKYLHELYFICNSAWDGSTKAAAINSLNEIFIKMIEKQPNEYGSFSGSINRIKKEDLEKY